MTYLDRAIKDGYAIITGPENKQKMDLYSWKKRKSLSYRFCVNMIFSPP